MIFLDTYSFRYTGNAVKIMVLQGAEHVCREKDASKDVVSYLGPMTRLTPQPTAHGRGQTTIVNNTKYYTYYKPII